MIKNFRSIKISHSHVFVFSFLFGEKKWGKYAALLRLPNEVLFDAFKFLDRRQLTNLERVCPRFHRIISNHIGEAPFLRLEIGFGFNARFLHFPLNLANSLDFGLGIPRQKILAALLARMPKTSAKLPN